MDGVPAGDDPDINDIGYYAPSRSLAFYYGDVGYWNGIVGVGRCTNQDMELIERQPDGFWSPSTAAELTSDQPAPSAPGQQKKGHCHEPDV
jgi:hypothetical protein